MSQFVVSARKYRPQTFDSVVGQEAITSTLKSAIRNDHLAQAFLFCGPRGVGKTTCARILARTINCENRGQDIKPCGQCEPCKSFEEGHSLNIYELDAASHNGVDHIRELTLQVNIAPQVGSRKVYIIDEVHMLSSAAFNAFLKTLEEPPPYAIFILATTEKHKILPTILSRCQVFDFKRISIPDMVAHLGHIAQEQGISTDQETLHVIAQRADGGLRDALSIFDQLVSFSGKSLSYEDVTRNLNVLDHSTYFGMTEKLLAGDVPGSLLLFDDVLQRGFDGHHFVNGLSKHFRDLLVVKDERSADLLETSEDVRKQYIAQTVNCATGFLFEGLDHLAQCDVEYKSSRSPRLLVELALMRIAREAMPAEKKSQVEYSAPQESDPDPAPIPEVSAHVVAEPEPPAVEENANPSRRISTGKVSINTYIKESEKEPEKATELPKNEVHEVVEIEESAFIEAWNAFANKKKQEGKNSLHATLMYKQPRLEGNTIHFAIINEVQDRVLREERADMLDELRSKLEAPGLEMVLEKEEIEELKPRYTSMDRFRILAEKNPDLVKFKDQLDLDLS